MPISGRPLLEHWLCILYRNNVQRVLVNVHHHHRIVEEFLEQPQFRNWVSSIHEPELLGTAGTLSLCLDRFVGDTILLAHADNWCNTNFSDFIDFHLNHRPEGTALTMMTFRTSSPQTCGIVELNCHGVLERFHEKVQNPPGNLANGAVYLLEAEVIEWLQKQPNLSDFSTEVLPHFIGRTATWENTDIHRDIGLLSSLVSAQTDPVLESCWPQISDWQLEFKNNPIHEMLQFPI